MRKNNTRIIKYLIESMQQEISSIDEICSQIGLLINKGEQGDEESKIFYKRAACSIIHDFYTGVEKIFREIAIKIDESLPKGDNWHIELLKSMATANEKRDAVISQELMEKLKQYLGFRHLFRNIYGMELEWEKLKILLTNIRENIWKRFKVEINSFIKWLKQTIN